MVTFSILGEWVSVGDPVGSSCQNVFYLDQEMRCPLGFGRPVASRSFCGAEEPTRGADNPLFLTAVPARALDARAFGPYRLSRYNDAGRWRGREVSVQCWGSRFTVMRSKSLGARSSVDRVVPKYGTLKRPGLGRCSGLESLAARKQVDRI